MSSSTAPPFETLLQSIAQSAPRPWYSADFAQSRGVPRDRLDVPLDQLRVAGLIAFTPWVSGKGQGYELTPHGADVLRSPRLMSNLRRGYIPAAPQMTEEHYDDPQVAGTALGRGDAVRRALLNRDKPKLTKILIIINLVVFAAGLGVTLWLKQPLESALVRGNGQAMHMTGSVTGADVLGGQWWRLVTCCFVHFGGLHLAMNMYSLWILGSIVENLWGRPRFLAIYMLAGFGGSCAAIYVNPNSNLAGASGAIWGIMASYPTWLIANRAYLPSQFVSQALKSLLPVIAINIFISFMPGISKEAHFGGGLVGVLVAVLLNFHRFGRDPVRWMFIGLVAVVPVLCVGALIRARESDARWRKGAAVIVANNRVMDENEQRDDFGAKYLKLIKATRKANVAVNGLAEELRRVPLANRRQADVAKILSQLETASRQVDELAKSMENAGPYESQFLRDGIKEILEALHHEKVVLELTGQSLTDVNWGDSDNEKWERAVDRLTAAWNRFEARLQ